MYHGRDMNRTSFYLVIVAVFLVRAPGHHGAVGSPSVEIGDWVASGYYYDPDAIPYSVCIPGMTETLLVGQGLNYPRLQYFTGLFSFPEWEFATGFSSSRVLLSADSSGRRVLCAGRETGMIYFFQPPDPFPTWRYLPEEEFIVSTLALSRRGNLGIVGILRSEKPYAVVAGIDPAAGSLLWTRPIPRETWYDGVVGSDVTDDGGLVLITTYMGIFILDGSDGSLAMLDGNYGQIPAKVSGDGEFIVSGDFDGIVSTYRLDPGTGQYECIWEYSIPGTWPDVAISRNGSTIVAGAFNPPEPDRSSVLVFDPLRGEPLWSFPVTDHIIPTLSAEGDMVFVGCWGPLDDSDDDFYIFRKESSSPIFTRNLAGSVYSVSANSTGNRVCVGCKAVHARILGRGGHVTLFTESGSMSYW